MVLVRQLQHGFTKNAKVSPNLTVTHIHKNVTRMTLMMYLFHTVKMLPVSHPMVIGAEECPSGTFNYFKGQIDSVRCEQSKATAIQSLASALQHTMCTPTLAAIILTCIYYMHVIFFQREQWPSQMNCDDKQ